MTNAITPMYRKTVYQVTYTRTTIEGNVTSSTKWYDTVEEIPTKYLEQKDAKLYKRSYDVFAQPTFDQIKEAQKTGNKFWLNTNDIIEEINFG